MFECFIYPLLYLFYTNDIVWGCSSDGRAFALHARGSGIDARHLHFFIIVCLESAPLSSLTYFSFLFLFFSFSFLFPFCFHVSIFCIDNLLGTLNVQCDIVFFANILFCLPYLIFSFFSLSFLLLFFLCLFCLFSFF